jgi:hypothetical protein
MESIIDLTHDVSLQQFLDSQLACKTRYWKTGEYKVLPENLYNMDEKGSMIGVTGRSKRIFSRATWEKKKKTESI